MGASSKKSKEDNEEAPQENILCADVPKSTREVGTQYDLDDILGNFDDHSYSIHTSSPVRAVTADITEVKFDVSRSQFAITDDSQEVLPASQKSEASEVETALDRDFDPSFSVHTSDSNQSLSDVIDSEPDNSTLSTERTNSTDVSKNYCF